MPIAWLLDQIDSVSASLAPGEVGGEWGFCNGLLKLMTGTICFMSRGPEGSVFELSNTNKLRIRVLQEDKLQVTMSIRDQANKLLLDIVENHVKIVAGSDVEYSIRPGHIRVTVPAKSDFLPTWLVNHVQIAEPEYAADGKIIVAELEVLKPGLVRIAGCWPDDDVAFVVTRDEILDLLRRLSAGSNPSRRCWRRFAVGI